MAVKDEEYLPDSFFTSPPACGGDDDDSIMSNGSSSSSSSTDKTTDDATSQPSLYNFSELMDQLPIKRGLSMFYKGKSESFMSLSKVSSLDDLKKKEIPYRRRRRCRTTKNSSRSYLPNPTTKFKKTPRASSSFSSSSFQSKRVSFVCRRNTPPKMTSLLKD